MVRHLSGIPCPSHSVEPEAILSGRGTWATGIFLRAPSHNRAIFWIIQRTVSHTSVTVNVREGSPQLHVHPALQPTYIRFLVPLVSWW
ncbi:hypothetical protein VTI74DRAFT_3228 [Chaetomium olivicolor]